MQIEKCKRIQDIGSTFVGVFNRFLFVASLYKASYFLNRNRLFSTAHFSTGVLAWKKDTWQLESACKYSTATTAVS